MMTENSRPSHIPDLAQRRARLAELRTRADAMLDELGQVVGALQPQDIRDDPWAGLSQLSRFLQRTDLKAASEDGRIWMLNRIGLLVARCFIARHGGSLEVQDDPGRRFFGNYVVTGMRCPAGPAATVDPFAIAHEAIYSSPKPEIMSLIVEAEAALGPPARGA